MGGNCNFQIIWVSMENQSSFHLVNTIIFFFVNYNEVKGHEWEIHLGIDKGEFRAFWQK